MEYNILCYYNLKLIIGFQFTFIDKINVKKNLLPSSNEDPLSAIRGNFYVSPFFIHTYHKRS